MHRSLSYLFAQIAWSCHTPCSPVDCSLLVPLSMESSRQEYWNGWPFFTVLGWQILASCVSWVTFWQSQFLSTSGFTASWDPPLFLCFWPWSNNWWLFSLRCSCPRTSSAHPNSASFPHQVRLHPAFHDFIAKPVPWGHPAPYPSPRALGAAAPHLCPLHRSGGCKPKAQWSAGLAPLGLSPGLADPLLAVSSNGLSSAHELLLAFPFLIGTPVLWHQDLQLWGLILSPDPLLWFPCLCYYRRRVACPREPCLPTLTWPLG